MPAYAARQFFTQMRVFSHPGARNAAWRMHMSGHVHSAAPWELKGNHQVPWSVMFPLVLEHALLVADGLLGTTCVHKLIKGFGLSVVQAIYAKEHPSPRQLSVPEAWSRDDIEAVRRPFIPTIAFVTERSLFCCLQ